MWPFKKKVEESEDESQSGYWVNNPPLGEAVYLQEGLYDEWYPISENVEVLVRRFDLVGTFWIRERK